MQNDVVECLVECPSDKYRYIIKYYKFDFIKVILLIVFSAIRIVEHAMRLHKMIVMIAQLISIFYQILVMPHPVQTHITAFTIQQAYRKNAFPATQVNKFNINLQNFANFPGVDLLSNNLKIFDNT